MVGAFAGVLACKQPTAPLHAPEHHGEATHDMKVFSVRTHLFEFRSSPTINLFDRLDGYDARRDSNIEACIQKLDAATQAEWNEAVERVRGFDTPGQAKARTRVRYGLAFPSLDLDEELGPLPSWLQTTLAATAPIYETCGWPEDDQRNRAWMLGVVEQLRPIEAPLARAIASALRFSWAPDPILIDIMTHGGRNGANTMLDPNHTVMSSLLDEHQDITAVEIVFHEATHTRFDGIHGEVMDALRAAAQAQGKRLPADLWHVVLFYTVGELTRRELAEHGISYVPYLYSQGLLARSWPAHQAPLEQYWGSYLSGETSLQDAAAALVAELGESVPDDGEAHTSADELPNDGTGEATLGAVDHRGDRMTAGSSL